MNPFFDAIKFIFVPRESVAGSVQVGGLAEMGFFTANHLLISFVALAIAIVISIPLGLYLGHIGKGEFLAISISNVGRAVPSLALLAFFIAFLGIGFANVAVVLVLLAIPPILTNTYVGVRQVDRDTVDAAHGMGLTDAQIVRRVELPLALPIIFGGIRTSAVNVVATATIGSLANVRTLGEPIFSSVIYGNVGALAGALVVALITLAADAGFGALQRAFTPKGLKLAPTTASSGRRLFTFPGRREQVT